MVGITLSPEQVRGAPPEVRRWLELQIAESLGLQRSAPAVEGVTRHLVGCDVAEARAVLSQIRNVLPVVSVFFELARDPAVMSPQGLRILHVEDMMRHSRLQTTGDVVACLEAINQALRRVSGDLEAAMTALDNAGHCLVPDVTARSILAVWQEIVSAHDATRNQSVPLEPAAGMTSQAFESPYAISVPPSAVAMGHQT
ncbi:MAG: hypothetical protein B7Z80_00860 [Rhodospirillales bacterium 20-64-7]|nr:MAG: hypothetical protein B7Z80_00860 [Rhodospirillales bacterium 20-64-7]HQT75739.1 hypothetical protein [Rhodopila sp.]